VEAVALDDDALKLQDCLESIFERGSITLCGVSLSALSFFEGLRILGRMLLRRPRGLALRRAVRSGIEDLSVDRATHARIEFLSNADRLIVMRCLAALLLEWPSNFLRACRSANITLGADLGRSKFRRNNAAWIFEAARALTRPGCSKNGARYSKEFRVQIVALARSGRSVSSLAREFGIGKCTILRWLSKVENDTGSSKVASCNKIFVDPMAA
jgi:hypothetical protein